MEAPAVIPTPLLRSLLDATIDVSDSAFNLSDCPYALSRSF
jgi:hypothetical protein